MRAARSLPFVLAAMMLTAAPLNGQENPADARQSESPAHAHMRHVADDFRGTPDGQGLLPTAAAEAAVAAQHAQLATRDRTDLAAMQRHAGHVLHALDPAQTEGGPGAGYGARKAADGTARHISLAAESSGATDNIRTHATHVSTAAKNAVTWSNEAIELVTQIREAETPEEAAALVDQLVTLTDAIVNGRDANGDGRIGWQEGEGGLAQATTHMGLMRAGEA